LNLFSVDFSASNESTTQSQNGAVESNGHSIDPSYIISPLTINDDFIYEASISKSLDFDKLIDKPEFVPNEQKEEEQPVEACKLVESTEASDLVEPKEAEQVTNNSYLNSKGQNMPVIHPAPVSLLHTKMVSQTFVTERVLNQRDMRKYKNWKSLFNNKMTK